MMTRNYSLGLILAAALAGCTIVDDTRPALPTRGPAGQPRAAASPEGLGLGNDAGVVPASAAAPAASEVPSEAAAPDPDAPDADAPEADEAETDAEGEGEGEES